MVVHGSSPMTEMELVTNKLTINYENAALVQFRLKKCSFSFFLKLIVVRLSRTVKGISFQIVGA